jgi:glycerophosphoryl diester phosphodiesterase
VPILSPGSDLLSEYPKPVILGHRGAKGYAPENTIEAFELALQHGCDGLEFDVRLSGDGQAVVCHDPKFERIEIARADRNSLPKLPTLEKVLERFADRAFLDIELKIPGVERVTLELLKQFPCTRGCVVSSFLPEVLREVHAMNVEVPLGLICRNRKQVANACSVPLTAIVLHASLVSKALTSTFRDRGIPVLVWGANRTKEMLSLLEAGADALIVDDTRLAVETFRTRAHAAGNP